MKNIKTLLLGIIFIFFIQISFSEDMTLKVNIENPDPSGTSLTSFKTKLENFVSYSNILEEKVKSEDFEGNSFEYSQEFDQPIFQVFFHPTSNEDYVLEVDDFGQNDDISLTFKKYQDNIYASNYSCNPTILAFDENSITIQSNLEDLKIVSHETSLKNLKAVDTNSLNADELEEFNDILNKYYYPKISVKKILQKYNETSQNYENITEFNTQNTLTNDIYGKYVLLDEDEKTFSLKIAILILMV